MKRYDFFLPPKPNGPDNVFVVAYGECSANFEFRPNLEPKLLSRSKLPIDEFEKCIANVNKVVSPLKERHLFNERLIIYYVLFGLLVVSTLAIALGIKISYIISVIIACLYCAGFVWLVLHVQVKNGILLK
jgi:positive regulator of sigma E activity